ncbi:TonB-dependent receptor [Asticcacaulis sp.]|uniref:TonB-dependent receptor n=1 Tax=Asticcacaulis sp. TaxID=1872648 RepID=UPI002626510A|nr:TonB-dependent receptor [Asticcacaulis sp.]
MAVLVGWLLGLSLAAPAGVEEAEIVVRGRLKPFRGDAAFSTLSVGKPAIEAASSLDEALKAEAQASLFRRQSSLSANPTIQGLSLRAIAPSGAGRALVTLDGVPQNDPFGGWVIWAGLPVDAIDRARVVRGAGGGAYGAGALTGVVDLDLAPPQSGVSGGVDWGDSGSWGAQVNGGVGGLSLHYSRARRYGDAAVRGTQRGAADEGIFGDDEAMLATWRGEARGHDLTLMAGRYDSRRDTGLSGATARARGHQYALSLTRPTGDTGDGYRLQVWYRDSDLSNRSVSVLSGRAGTSLANDQFATPAEGYGLNAAWRGESATSEWEAGIDARRSEGQARERFRYVSGIATRYRQAGGRTDLAGLYVQGTRRFGSVSLTGAVRADNWRATRGFRRETDLSNGASVLDLHPANADATVVSARLGLTRQAGVQQWRAAVYNGFRPPSLNELYRPFRVGNDVTEANSALKPETLSGIEVGWRYAADGLSVDLGVFHNRLRDPISNITVGFGPGTFPTAGFIPAGGVLRQRQNAGEVRATGVELSARWQAAERLTLTLSGTATDAEMAGGDPALNGKRPAQAPAYLLSVGGEYRLDRTRLSAEGLFIGESFEDDLNRQRLSPAVRLRLTAERPVTDELSVRLSVDNALDTDIPIQRTADGVLSYDNRRSVMLSLRWRQSAIR